MIQYLNDPYPPSTFEQWKLVQAISPYSEFKIKKFADKLKDIVCMLIGCTRVQLEDREFKESLLGEEWQGYQVSWDCPIDEWEKIFSTEEDALNYLINNGADEWDIKHAYEDKLIRRITLTPRLLLQLLGTDCGRKIIHPNIWVNALFADYKLIDNRSWQDPDDSNIKYPNWIITDVRFPNEVEEIKDRGGIVIRVNRPKPEKVTNDLVTHIEEHESETALDKYEKFDHIITNDGSINDLYNKIKECL